MRRIIVISLVLLLLIPVVSMSAQADPVASAAWLAAQQEENGSFGGAVGPTALSLMALSAVGEENPAALEWLSTQPFSEMSLSELSLSLIALVATGADVSNFADGELLANYSEELRDVDNLDTDEYCMGLIARYVFEVPISQAQNDALAILIRDDGSFGADIGEDSDIITTSLCVQALVATELDASVALALDYIRSQQRADGGWSLYPNVETSDPYATAHVMQALIAADQSFSDWENPERTLIEFADERGAFLFGDGQNNVFNLISTAVAIPVFQGMSLLDFSPVMQAVSDASVASDAPLLNANWKLVGDGFQIELDTADDFFTTVVDPFTDEELYGVEIINWTTDYPYTGYIVEQYLTADIILWMAEQDPTVLDMISVATLLKMPAEELVNLPAELQARAAEAE